MACSVSLEFRLGLGNRNLIQSIAETRDVGLRTLGSELPTKRTGEGVSLRERGTDYSHTFCPGPQNGLGYRKLGQLIGSKATLTVAFLQDLHAAASLILLPAWQELCAGVHQASVSCLLVLVLKTPQPSLTLTSILPLSHQSVISTPSSHKITIDSGKGEERSGTRLRESLDSALLPGIRPSLCPPELRRSHCTEGGGVL